MAMRGVRPADPPTEVRPEWLQVLATLPAEVTLLVLGPSDVGKTTVCWWLAEELRRRGRQVALVDADGGQSRIGPPASVGWLKLGSQEWGFYFVGATTPARRPASHLRATVLAREAAIAAGARCVVVDTTGLVRGEIGKSLKQAKIQRLRPVHVLSIGDSADVAAILEPWLEDPQVVIHRIPQPPAAVEKPRLARVRWRHQGFGEWLMGSNLRWIAAQGRRFVHLPPRELYGEPEAAAELRGLLIGFSDAALNGLCVGLLHQIDWAGGRLLALCPPEAERAQVVDFGCVRLQPDGTQIPARRP